MHKLVLLDKLEKKIHRKSSILQKRDLYLNQFSNKKGATGKPERPKRHPIWAAHPRTHRFPLSTPTQSNPYTNRAKVLTAKAENRSSLESDCNLFYLATTFIKRRSRG